MKHALTEKSKENPTDTPPQPSTTANKDLPVATITSISSRYSPTNSSSTTDVGSVGVVDELATLQRINKPVQPVTNGSGTVAICLCHINETSNLNNHDLQIEMVLQCNNCGVIFRRTNCFEVHFRVNPECRKVRSAMSNIRVTIMLCSSCPFILRSLPEMRGHLEMHAKCRSDGTVTFICNICKVAFFGVGSIFYTHWFHHLKDANFVASKYSFPKLSIVSVLEDTGVNISSKKTDEGFFYIAEHVCKNCK